MCDPGPNSSPMGVILAAGEGSRLSERQRDTPKPVQPLLGMSLGERTLVACLDAGIRRFLIVLGHRGDRVRAHFQQIAARRGCDVDFVTAPDWELGNGASTLAAADKVGDDPFLLAMSDHVVSPSLIKVILRARPREGEVCLAVDHNTAGVFDLDDATKVALSGDRVIQIGKALCKWDAADAGILFCTRTLFDGIRQGMNRHQCSLTDGLSELAAGGRVRAVDVTGESWIDVDTQEAWREARRRLLGALVKRDEDGYVSVRLNRPVSTRLSARLAGTSITANQLTLLSFLISLVAAAFFSTGRYVTGLVGGLLVQFGSILDGCDGEIARLKHQSSPHGAWLDTVLDRYADAGVGLAITYGFAAAHAGPLPWVAGFLAVLGLIMASYVTKEYTIRHGRPYANNVLNRLKRRDVRLLLICLGAVVGRPFEALILAGALSHSCVLGILATAPE